MNVIDKTWISISLAAGVVLADTLPVLAGDTGGTIGGGLDVKGILNEATTTPTGTAAGAPFIEKVKAFGATAAICTFIIAIKQSIQQAIATVWYMTLPPFTTMSYSEWKGASDPDGSEPLFK